MMGSDHVSGLVQPVDVADNILALRDMRMHDLGFFRIKAGWLAKNRVGNADLADIVEKAADDQGLHRFPLQSEAFADTRCGPCDPEIVRPGVGIPFRYRASERFHHRYVRRQDFVGLPLIFRIQTHNDRIDHRAAH